MSIKDILNEVCPMNRDTFARIDYYRKRMFEDRVQDFQNVSRNTMLISRWLQYSHNYNDFNIPIARASEWDEPWFAYFRNKFYRYVYGGRPLLHDSDDDTSFADEVEAIILAHL